MANVHHELRRVTRNLAVNKAKGRFKKWKSFYRVYWIIGL